MTGREAGAYPVPAIEINRDGGDWPDDAAMEDTVRRAIDAACATARPVLDEDAELSVLLTDDAAMQVLNSRWRGIDKPTNVLSFPFDAGPMLGDIVLAFQTVQSEAVLANRELDHHIAHLIIHGFFHILGYDHADDRQARTMETLERTALSRLGIADPYAPSLPLT